MWFFKRKQAPAPEPEPTKEESKRVATLEDLHKVIRDSAFNMERLTIHEQHSVGDLLRVQMFSAWRGLERNGVLKHDCEHGYYRRSAPKETVTCLACACVALSEV